MHKCIDGGVFRKPFSSYKNKPKLIINYELWKNEKIKNHNSLRKNNLKILLMKDMKILLKINIFWMKFLENNLHNIYLKN